MEVREQAMRPSGRNTGKGNIGKSTESVACFDVLKVKRPMWLVWSK